MHILKYIFDIFVEKGGMSYVGEPITQLEHAIQTALAAKRYQARSTLITAALLHDIGHLLHVYSENCADEEIDSQHEIVGEAFLKDFFNYEVTELIRQHVNAKRYLTATNEKYSSHLTKASYHSLQLQGGPMNQHEAQQFQSQPLFKDILLLRSWDEGAKIPNKQLPSITTFKADLEASLL